MDVSSSFRLCFFRQNVPLTFRVEGGKVFVINSDVPPTAEEAQLATELSTEASVQNAAHIPEGQTDQTAEGAEDADEEGRPDDPIDVKIPKREHNEDPDISTAIAPAITSDEMEDSSMDASLQALSQVIQEPPTEAADGQPAAEDEQADSYVEDYSSSSQLPARRGSTVADCSPFTADAPSIVPPPSDSTAASGSSSPPPLPSQPPPGWKPPPPPRRPSQVDTSPADSQAQGDASPMKADSGQSIKILVESVELFGHNIKKILRLSLLPGEPPLSQLLASLRTSYGNLANMQNLLVVYHDADVSEFVVLDEGSWEEFIVQVKHLIKLTVLPATAIPAPVAAVANGDEVAEGEQIDSDQQDSHPELMALPPPPPPYQPPPLPAGEAETARRSSKSYDQPSSHSMIGYNEEATAMLEYFAAPVVSTAGACVHLDWAACTALPIQVHRYQVIGVNGVRLADLDQDFQVALIKQKQRPITIDFMAVTSYSAPEPTRISPGPEESSSDNALSVSSSGKSKKERISNNLFLSKYNSSPASKLRKQVDKLLTDFMECDWYTAKLQNTGFAHATIVSLYKYIEAELIKLELFNSKHRRGADVPDELSEPDFDVLKNHIEALIFKRVANHTKALWPIYNPSTASNNRLDPDVAYIDAHLNICYKSRQYDLVNVDLELSPDHNINMKMAFLRFITLENLGLTHPDKKKEHEHKEHPELTPPSSDVQASFMQALIHREEWYLIMKACNRAVKFDTPGEILSKFVKIMKLVSHALDAHINRAHLHNVCCTCGKVHLLDCQISVIDYLNTNKHDQVVKDLFALRAVSSDLNYNTGYALSADDLLPAIVYVLIQSNPSNLEYILFICTEYRHPHLLKGEESYILTQLTSALEFIKFASHSAFEIPRDVYNTMLMRYKYTLSLLLECKNGHMGNVKHYISKGADVNALSPDHKDNALTACIRYNHYEILCYLCTLPSDVNACVHLFRGTYERCTPLLLAVEYNLPHVVVLLLNYRANRYLQDYNHTSAFQLANAQKYHLVETVLLADPAVYNLTDIILKGNKRIALGLVLQNISLDYVYNRYFTNLMTCVYNYRIDLFKLLLCNPHRPLDINLANDLGENCLLVCVKQFIYLVQAHAEVSPLVLYKLHRLYQFMAVLLRYGADRHAVDNYNHSAYSLMEAFESITEAKSCVSPTIEYLNNIRNINHIYHDLHGLPPPSAQSIETHHTIIISDNMNTENFSKIYPAKKDIIGKMVQEAIEDVRALLLCDPFASQQSKNDPPLYEITRRQQHSVVKAMLVQGVDVNSRCPKSGYTSLIAAVYNKDLKMCRMLINAEHLYNFSDVCYHDEYGGLVKYYSAFDKMGNVNELKHKHFLANNSAIGGGHQLVAPNAYKLDINLSTHNHMSALHYAAQGGNVEVVSLLLGHHINRALINNKNHTALDIATANNHVDVTNMIRYDPAKVSICFAAKHGDLTVMKALLLQGVSINCTKKHLLTNTQLVQHEIYTPLHAAVAYNQYDCLKYILSADKVDINAQNLLGYTALHYAAYNKNEAIVLRLLKAGVDRYLPDISGQLAINLASVSAGVAIYVNTSSPTNPHSMPLADAAVIKDILSNDPERVFVQDIIRRNDFSGVVAMLKQGASVNDQRTTLHKEIAVIPDKTDKRSSKKVKDAAPSLAETFINGETPLIVAACFNRMEIITLLFKAPDLIVDLPDIGGWTALFHAANAGHEDVVLLLLKAKANRKHLDNHKKTAADIANTANQLQIAAYIESDPYCVHIHDMCEKGKMLHVIALLKQGCPANYRDERMGLHNQTPLMAAATGGKVEIIRMLLRLPAAMASIDDQDLQGRTALMRAAAAGALDVTAILLNAGCDRNIKDRNGLTAYDHASRHSYSVMFKYSAQTCIR